MPCVLRLRISATRNLIQKELCLLAVVVFIRDFVACEQDRQRFAVSAQPNNILIHLESGSIVKPVVEKTARCFRVAGAAI